MDNVKLPKEVQQVFNALGVSNVQGAVAAIGVVITMIIGIIGGLASGDTSSKAGIKGSSNDSKPSVTAPAKPGNQGTTRPTANPRPSAAPTTSQTTPTTTENPVDTMPQPAPLYTGSKPVPLADVTFEGRNNGYEFRQMQAGVMLNGTPDYDAYVALYPNRWGNWDTDVEGRASNSRFWDNLYILSFNNANNATPYSYSEFDATFDFMDNTPSTFYTLVRFWEGDTEKFLNPKDYPGFTFGKDGRLQLRPGNEPFNLKYDLKDVRELQIDFHGINNSGAKTNIIGLTMQNPVFK